MPNHNLCINADLKRCLGKMRENLFQRRLNLAIYEKTINEWSLPQLRQELWRKRLALLDNSEVVYVGLTIDQELQRLRWGAPPTKPVRLLGLVLQLVAQDQSQLST